MRRLLLFLSLLALALLPATAQAHITNFDITFSGSPWSSTDTCCAYTNLNPGGGATLDPGQIIEVRNTGGHPGHFLLATYIGPGYHWEDHFTSVEKTGPETMRFTDAYGDVLGTRRINGSTPGIGSFKAVRFHHYGGPRGFVITAGS